MSVTATAVVTFDVGDADEVKAIVDAWPIPEGAAVSITASEVLQSGVVDASGDVIPTAVPPPDSSEAPA